jgi:hypothetical protein
MADAPGKYSAGTIFLQVVPVFRDLQRELRREAKDANAAIAADLEDAGREGGKRASKAFGEEMEKGAEKSGKKSSSKYAGAFEENIKRSVKSAQKELDSLSFKDSSIAMEEDFKRIKRKLKEIGDVKLDVDFDEKKLLADIALVQGSITALTKKDHDLRFSANLDVISRQMATIEKRAEAMEKKRRELKFGADLDTKVVERKLGSFERILKARLKNATDSLGEGMSQQIDIIRAKLQTISDAEIGIDLHAGDALRQIATIEGELEALAGEDIDIQAHIDVAKALTELAALQSAVGILDGRDIDIQVDVDAGGAIAKLGLVGALMAAFRPQANKFGSASDNAANAFRALNLVILAAVVLLPTLVPILGAVGGGLLALIPILGALGTGLGVAILGFSGIGNALTELGKVSDERKFQAQTEAGAEHKLASSLNAVEDAERALANARRSAARATADAERALADARRNAARAAADAERQVKEAREQAAEAIEAAYERQEQAAKALADAQDSVREAEQALADARQKARDDAASLDEKQRKASVDERQRVLDLMDAQATYNAVLADGSSTNVDKEQASINLENAQIALNEIRQTQADLTKEQQDYAQNGVEGNENVQSAQDALTEALERQKEAQEAVAQAAEDAKDAQLDAAKQIADAIRSQRRTLSDNARAIADAQRNLARTNADNARSIADAQRSLARARQQHAQTVTETNDELTASEKRLQTAMDKLSPAGRRFARFLFGLRDEAKALRDAVQEAMLPGVQRGLETIIKTYGPQFKSFAARMGKAVGDIFDEAGEALGGPEWKRFFKTYGKMLPGLFKDGARTIGNFITAFANVMDAIAPFVKRFSKALLGMSRDVRHFFDSGKGRNAVKDFMAYAAQVGPKVAELIGALAGALAHIARALAPIGSKILDGVVSILDGIAGMDTGTLQAIAFAIIVLTTAFQAAAAVSAIFATGGIILASPVATIAFAVIALVGALTLLYIRSEKVRTIIDALGRGVKFLWEHYVRPFLGKVGDYFVWQFKSIQSTWNNVLKPVLAAVWGAIKFLWEKVAQPVLKAFGWYFKTIFTAVKWYWDHILWPVLDLIVTFFWKELAPTKAVLDDLKSAWHLMATGFKWAWDNIIKPIFDFFKDSLTKEPNGLIPTFKNAMQTLGELWDGLKDKMAAPVRWVIDKVINNGIIDAFNWVAGKVGSTTIDKIKLPDWGTEPSTKKAQGGVLPGYTPGRDVHQFISPTAGRLELSGGEAIMRPEWTAAMGKQGVDYWNNLSKRGVGAVRAAMNGQAFAKGGIFWPVPGRETGTYPGHDGVDINRGSGWDDFGDPIVAAHDGYVEYVGAGRGYGDAIWIRGTDGFTTLYGHTSQQHVGFGNIVQGGQLIGNVGNTGHSSAPHLHFGVYPGGTFEAALAYLNGALAYPGSEPGDGGGGFHLPGWVGKILSGPVHWLKDRISAPIHAFEDKFGGGDNIWADAVIGMPKNLMSAVGDKIGDMASTVGGAIGHVVGGALDHIGLADGGILPYNGAMKYDSGGMLPPGLTNVINLTGKPEPVFTASQFANMGTDGDGSGGNFTYAPTFHNSDLTPADLVDDIDFARRKVQRDGKYGRSR